MYIFTTITKKIKKKSYQTRSSLNCKYLLELKERPTYLRIDLCIKCADSTSVSVRQ